MIVSKIKDLHRYKGLNNNLDTAIDYILKNDLSNLKYGRNEVDNDKLFHAPVVLCKSPNYFDLFYNLTTDYLATNLKVSSAIYSIL